MNTEKILLGNRVVVAINETEPVMTDVQSALDLMATLKYEHDGCDAIIIPKEAVAEDFFQLRTRVAGEILQKFINYYMKLAIIGDFSGYTSKSLADFIWESNRGKDIFFVPTQSEALRLLEKAFA